MSTEGKITDPGLIFAGNAVFTALNSETGNRFTYRIRISPDDPPRNRVHFVQVLTGPDNMNNYTFIGTLFGRGTYRHSPKSPISDRAQSVRVISWLVDRICNRGGLPPQVEIHHRGKCLKCGRALTDPESIQRGVGPICAEG